MAVEYVKPGQKLRRIKASDWNDILNCKEAWKTGQLGSRPAQMGPVIGDYIIDIRNDSGADVDILTIMCIDAPLITPDDDDYNLFMTLPPTFSAISLSDWESSEPLCFARFIVTKEPIKDGKVGKAQLYGCTPSFINVTAGLEDFFYAVPDSAEPNILVSWPFGPFRVLWRAGGSGDQPCFVSFPETTFQNLADPGGLNYYEIDRSDPADDALVWDPVNDLPTDWADYDGLKLTTENLRYRAGASATLEYIYQTYYWLTPFAPVIAAVTPEEATTNICPNAS